MLVLARKLNEEIVIRYPGGAEVVVRLLDIIGAQVRLGITAPRDVIVDRREIHDKRLAAEQLPDRYPDAEE